MMKNKFKNTSQISREEIKSLHGKSSETMEGKDNPFVNDSIEGWQQLNNDFSSMEELDHRFLNKKTASISSTKIFALLMTLVSLVLLVVLFVPKDSNDQQVANESDATTKQNLNDEKIIIEASDIAIEPEIEQLKEPVSDLQISPRVITEDYSNQLNEDQSISTLPLRPIENINDIVDQPLPNNRKRGKEVYLRNFKAVDYSAYRQTKAVKTDQIILSGTPANKNTEHAHSFSEIEKSTIEIDYMEYLSKTLHYFDRSNFKQTLTRCNIILSQYPNDVNAQFYKAICLYNLGQHQESIPQFKTCLMNSFTNFDEECLWYLAQAYEVSNNSAEARKIYLRIIEQDGYYSEQSKERVK